MTRYAALAPLALACSVMFVGALYAQDIGRLLARGGTATAVALRVSLLVESVAGGRSPGGEVVRVLGDLLGARRGSTATLRRVRSALTGYAPDVVTVRLPGSTGSYRLTIRVDDLVSGRSAQSSRVITVILDAN